MAEAPIYHTQRVGWAAVGVTPTGAAGTIGRRPLPGLLQAG